MSDLHPSHTTDTSPARSPDAEAGDPSSNWVLLLIRSVTVARLALAAASGLVVGAVLEWSVPHLPFFLEPLGNAAGPWVVTAFVVALTARRTGDSLVLAIIALLGLVVGFYVAQALRGWGVSWHQIGLWSVASLVMGPLIGLAAGWLRHGGRTVGALGAGVLGGLFVGEALYGLTELKLSSPADYWHVQLIVGIGAAIGLTGWRCRSHMHDSVRAIAVSLAACATVGLATLAVFQTV